MRTTLVKYFHEQPVFARMGIAQTINRVQREFVWKGMNIHKYKQVGKIMYWLPKEQTIA